MHLCVFFLAHGEYDASLRLLRFTDVRIEEEVLLMCKLDEVARKVAVVFDMRVRTFWRKFQMK